MNSQFLMLQREVIFCLSFATNVNQSLNQTIRDNSFRAHLSNEFENDQDKNQSLKTFFKIILKRSRRREVDRRYTLIEQFVEKSIEDALLSSNSSRSRNKKNLY